MNVHISIIIVNWNGGELLRECLHSITQHPASSGFQILAVDNASTDGSREWLESSGVLGLIKNERNVGFGQAVNQALALAKAEFILLINPDAQVSPGAIDTLIAALRADGRIGACGPRLLNADGSVQVSVWHNPPRVWQILLSQLKLYSLIPQPLRGEILLGGHWRHDRKRTVPMLGGAAIMVRREMIANVGGFDERFHMYGEDNEWCWRIRKAGWQLMFEPGATVVHHAGHSAKQRWPDIEKLRVQLEAGYLFEKCALPRWRLVANQLAYYFTSSAQKAWYRMCGVPRPDVELAHQIHREHLRQSRKHRASSPLGHDTNAPDAPAAQQD